MLRSFTRPFFRFSKGKDLYSIMGLAKGSTSAEIKKQYLQLAKKYHPDYSPTTAERFKDINAAYQVLGDENKRREYDYVGQSAFGTRTHTSYNNSYTHNDPFKNSGFYNTQRQKPDSTYQTNSHSRQDQQANMWREYYRQKVHEQQAQWRNYEARDNRYPAGADQYPQYSPVRSLWLFFGSGIFLYLLSQFFLAHGSNQKYVKVRDPISAKVTIMSQKQFNRQKSFQQLANSLAEGGNRRA